MRSRSHEKTARWWTCSSPSPSTEVKFENDTSDEYTIIDVFASDRPGLLYAITRTLSQLGLSIARAKVSTEATKAIDSFYVRGADGKKLYEGPKLSEARDKLEDAISA